MSSHQKSTSFDYEARKDKEQGYDKKVVISLVLIIVALLATTIAFVVLYVEQINVTPTALPPTTDPAVPTNATTGPTPSVTPAVGKCDTTGCYLAAESLRKSMNLMVNPCDDFYEFACGNWNKTEPMPEDKGRWGVFDVLRRELSGTLRDLLNVTHEDGNTLNATQKMQKYFQACHNEEAIDNTGVSPLVNHMLQIFPEFKSWPFTDESHSPTLDESLQAIARARKYGLTMGIFNNYITSDYDNPRTNTITFDASGLGMDTRFYLKGENGTEVIAYEEYLTDMIALLRAKASPSNVTTTYTALDTAKAFIRFETLLARAKLTPEERRNVTLLRNKMTLAEFASNYTVKFGLTVEGLLDYFKGAWDNAQINSTLSASTIINVVEPRYYWVLTEGLMDLLANSTETLTGRNFLANYLVWQIGRSYVSRLDREFRNISATFSAKLRGVAAEVPRWETCSNLVNNEFPNAVGRLYVEQNFKTETKQRLQKMVTYLSNSFKEIIEDTEWMSPATKVNALEKANSISVLVGYEDYIVDDSERLNKEHEDFAATSSFIQSTFSMQQLMTKEEGKQFLNGTLPTTWITGAAVVNAFYAPSLNSISFPAGILQPPFLGGDYPDYWNFGAVGTVIGHEITHGFDDKGSLYAANGSFSFWWDTESRDNFIERADAMVEQYSKYTLMGIPLNGRLTQGENIADNGGMKESFYAYRKFIEVEKAGIQEPNLPYLNYSPEQVFFLANSQVWCSDFKQKELENQINTGAHSPGRFRVIGPLQNFPEFSEAYNCPVGSYMNPAKKSPVW